MAENAQIPEIESMKARTTKTNQQKAGRINETFVAKCIFSVGKRAKVEAVYTFHSDSDCATHKYLRII